MALRLGFHNVQEKASLLGQAGDRCCTPVTHFVRAVWPIVFTCVCLGGCRRESPPGNSTPCHAYNVLVTRHSDTYYPRTYRAVLATDGRRWRIAFYGLDPPEEIEPMDALAFSDFLFDSNRVWYWHHKDKRTHTSSLEPRSADYATQLPTGKGLETILGSILTLVAHNRTYVRGQRKTTEASEYFQRAKQQDSLKHTTGPAPMHETTDVLLSRWATGDSGVLDLLPFGRTYSKEGDQEGGVVWRMSKATVAMEKVRVTVRPVALRNMSGSSEMGDVGTLGRWSAVPDAYRRYWSLRDRALGLRRQPSVPEGQRLYADISSALRGALPDDLNSPLRELLFRTSLHTGSDDAMRSSACQYFNTYVHLAQEPVERIVIELGRIGQELRARWAEDQTCDFIRPLLKGIVDPNVFAEPEFVEEDVLKWVHTQGPAWSWYRRLVRESVQEATGTRLGPASYIGTPSAESNAPMSIGDSEPNDDIAPMESREDE